MITDTFEIVLYEVKEPNSYGRGSWVYLQKSMISIKEAKQIRLEEKRKYRKYLDFRINGELLSEIIQVNFESDYLCVFNLGVDLYLNYPNYAFMKLQQYLMLGVSIDDAVLNDICLNYNNCSVTYDGLKHRFLEEEEGMLSLSVCKACGDYGCGVDRIGIQFLGKTIKWDFSSFYGHRPLKRGKAFYEFDIHEYYQELKNYEEIWIAINQNKPPK